MPMRVAVVSLVCLGFLFFMAPNRNATIENLNTNRFEDCRLTAIRFTGEIHPTRRQRLVYCICECGNDNIVTYCDFRTGNVRSCGCLRIDRHAGQKWSNLGHDIPELKIAYRSMLNRCYNDSQVGYNRYGGRGVMVCDEWIGSYKSFLDWSLTNGWEKGKVLDKDILGNGLIYSPSTCKWVSVLENVRNRRNTVKIDYNGSLIPLAEVADILCVKYLTFRDCVNRYGKDNAIYYYENKLHLKYKKACTYFRHHHNI